MFEARKEIFLFDDALNIFHLRFYGVGHMVKDHTDSERINLLQIFQWLLFPISKMESMDRKTHRLAERLAG